MSSAWYLGYRVAAMCASLDVVRVAGCGRPILEGRDMVGL